MGPRAGHRGLRHRARSSLGDRLRRRRRLGRGLGRRGRRSAEPIVRRGKVDAAGEPANYWHTHAAGPAGPCSEIFVDRGPAYGPDGRSRRGRGALHGDLEPGLHAGRDRRVARDRRSPARENVDTGSSLERVATVLQGVDNVFETDLFAADPRDRGVAVRSRATGTDASDDVSLEDHRRARPGDGVPDRRRRPARERGPRLHPAPHAAAGGGARAAARDRGRRCSRR